MHKALYRDNLPLAGARAQIEGLVQAYPDAAADVQLLLSFLDQVAPGRGIVR